MAGLLDYIGGGILPNGYRLQVPEWAQLAGQAALGVANPMQAAIRSFGPGGYGNELGKFVGQQFVVPDENYKGAPTQQPFAQGGGGSGWGDGPTPAHAVLQQDVPPLQTWAQSPQVAQQGFNAPTGSYAFGGQMVPFYGRPQQDNAALPANAQPTAGRPPSNVPVNAPDTQRPSFSSELLGAPANTAEDKYNAFFDRFRPGYAERRDATKAQSETARGLYEIYRGQGMSPNEAASRAVIEARNPKIMEERMKPYANMEQRLANQPDNTSGPGGNAWNAALKWKQDNKAAETAGEVGGKTQTEAQINLPGAAADFQQSMQTISDLRNHKGRESIGWHGPTANVPADFLRGSEAYGAVKLEERLKSRVFGDQVKTMVGMGALSNAEGQKITDAVASLDRGLKKDEYNRTLDFIQAAMKNGMDKIATKANQPAPFGWKGNDGWMEAPGGIRIRERR